MKLKKIAFLFLIFILSLSLFLKLDSLIEPVDQVNPKQVRIKIEAGMSGRAIADRLEEKAVIKSSKVFYFLLRLKKINNLRTGYYQISTSNTLLEIITKIQTGKEEEFKITIPEGFTFDEIITRFSELDFPNYESQKLKQEIYQLLPKLKEELNFKANIIKSELIYPVEGIIIPTTYKFPLSYQEADIANYLVKYFIKNRVPVLKKAAKNNKFSAYELLIIASLIEEEGKIDSENDIIASVIYNRLAKKMPLQLDATVQYALAERTKRVLYSDLEVDSPYNTYKTKELPPTPIASPGAKALKAAINPAATNYLFYFAQADGSHIFSRNYQEHLNKQRQRN